MTSLTLKYKVLILICFFSYSILHGQTTYYIDNTNGIDNNSGTSPEYAIKTIEQLHSIDLLPGDSVLFKKGNWWRYQLKLLSGDSSSDIYYGAYGDGPLPIISTSLNMNKNSDWTLESENIWQCKTDFSSDVGNIIFNNEHHTGLKKWNLSGLHVQGDYYYDLSTGTLSMFSVENPGQLYNEIECAVRYDAVEMTNTSYVTIEHLAIKYSAAHGFGGSNTSHITIRNCEISWIGGGDLNMDGSTIRYGNGVEFWCDAEHNTVENNKIWEIFDTGVTNQCHSGSTQSDIVYRNNVIWNCGMSALEIWNRPATSITENIFFENNTCVNMGQGWSADQRSDNLATCFAEFTNESQTSNINIQNNIFFNPRRFFYVYQNDNFFSNMNTDYNCYFTYSPTTVFCVNYNTQDNYHVEDFDTYQSDMNKDLNSFFDDPLFVDTIINDYHITANSPCIDMAFNSGILYDHDGNIRTALNGIDIGAYEYFGLTRIEYLTKNEFNIYPNPVLDLLYVENFNNLNIDKYAIYAVTGKLIKQENRESLKSGIETTGLVNGIYFLKIQYDNKIKIKKFVKQ